MKAYKTLYSITKDQEASRYIPIATIPYFCREVPAEFRANSKTRYVIGYTILSCIISTIVGIFIVFAKKKMLKTSALKRS